ncbi:MAG: hypothetical protein L0J79_04005, partial [Propionibacterium sp.]|nr:hypothetical protein [Propionibacterium sp.]
MSKMRLNPATIGVVRSAAMPQAVKHPMTATIITSVPGKSRGIRPWWRAAGGEDPSGPDEGGAPSLLHVGALTPDICGLLVHGRGAAGRVVGASVFLF